MFFSIQNIGSSNEFDTAACEGQKPVRIFTDDLFAHISLFFSISDETMKTGLAGDLVDLSGKKTENSKDNSGNKIPDATLIEKTMSRDERWQT